MTGSGGNRVSAGYFPVSPLMLFPEAMGNFSVYLRQDGGFVLYTKAGETFTDAHRKRLHDMGVEDIYVESADKQDFDVYVAANLGRILQDDSLLPTERSRVFMDTAGGALQEALGTKLPQGLPPKLFRRMADIVDASLDFLSDSQGLKAMGPFISKDYQTYTHSLQVFLYTVSTLATYGVPRDELYEFGLGAMLHDLGKTKISNRILLKKGSLTQEERVIINTHPVQGVALCANLGISQATFNCILFHHERLNGMGYPSGLEGDDIPLAVRVLSLADAYDALTTARPYSGAMTAFEALTIIRHDMEGQFDMNVYKRFVEVLSGANLM